MIDFNEISVLDRNALYWGVPTHSLMENAGTAVAEEVLKVHKNNLKSIAVFCGLGNNGGDGMVAARLFAQKYDCYVRLYLLGRSSELRTRLAIEQFCRLPKNVEIIILDKLDNKTKKSIDLTGFSTVIDAMLGVGIKGKLREPYYSVVKIINSIPKQIPSQKSGKKDKSKSSRRGKRSINTQMPTIISVDVPTGLGTKTAIKPDITITFHDSKTGMTKGNSGIIVIKEIGIPKEAEKFVGPGELTFIPKLSRNSHKGDHGRLVIVGGGPYTGAPALVGLSGLRTGVDLVHIMAPSNVSPTIASFSPNFILHPLHKGTDYLTEADVAQIISTIKDMSADAVVIGPGLGKEKQTSLAINKIISKLPKKISCVLDADAFNALANNDVQNLLKGHQGVMTPHAGEFNQIRGKTSSIKISLFGPTELAAASEVIKRFAKSLGSSWSVLVKGQTDIITNGNSIYLNQTGNPGMTVGGTGDVLAGITGALLALGLTPNRAARAAAFINGYSGDLAWEKCNRGLTATDIIEFIPQCFKDNLMDE